MHIYDNHLCLLSLHWLNIPFNDNLAIAAWVSLAGFGSLYWLLRMNRQSSIISDMTLCAATVPAIVLPIINLPATYDLSFKILGWLAAVAALYMAVLAKRDWRIMTIAAHPSLVLLLYLIAQWFTIPLEFMSVVALIVLRYFTVWLLLRESERCRVVGITLHSIAPSAGR